MLLGCIADDVTGATDLASTLVREGMRTVQVLGVPTGEMAPPEADAVVVALKSRTIPAGDAVAQSLAANDSIRVEVGGHTDNTGSRATNLALSQARAEAVRHYLVRHGVAADRLVARGYGPDSPVAGNGTREGRAQNRRVELRRID